MGNPRLSFYSNRNRSIKQRINEFWPASFWNGSYLERLPTLVVRIQDKSLLAAAFTECNERIGNAG